MDAPGSLHERDALLVHGSGVWLQQRKQVSDEVKAANTAIIVLFGEKPASENTKTKPNPDVDVVDVGR